MTIFLPMPICRTCGAPLGTEGAPCDYSAPLDRAPGIGDAEAISGGSQSLADHELHIARWRVHHPEERGATPKVMTWARERLAREGHVVPDA